MAAVPLLEEMSGSPSGAMIAELAGFAHDIGDPAQMVLIGAVTVSLVTVGIDTPKGVPGSG